MICSHHKPSKVVYRYVAPYGDKWTITHGDYSLYYNKGRTLFRKINEKSEKSQEFYTIIKRFDHELNIKPEDFGKKIPTLLTFL